MINILSFTKTVENFIKPVEKFIQDNFNNPLMWLGIFGVGILVFNMTHSALQKEK
jgi:hypothetical protein